MTRAILGLACGLFACVSFGYGMGGPDEIPGSRFSAPQRLKAGDGYVKVEAPGYAAPCWADVDGDGKKDLLVGQFAGGKIMVHKNLGEGKLAKGDWLKIGEEVVEVPGVW